MNEPKIISDKTLSDQLEELKKINESFSKEINELRYKEYLLNMILSNIPQSIYFKDSYGRYIGSSKSTAKKFGLTDENDLIGQSDSSFYAKEYFKEITDHEQEILKTGKPIIDVETQETWPDGTRTYSIKSKLPLRTPQGNNIGIFGISTDITKQKESDMALQNNLNFLEVLINTIPTPIYYKDTLGRFQGCNNAFVDLIKRPRAELLNKNVFDIFLKDSAEFLNGKDRELFKSNTQQNFEHTIELPDGAQKDFVFYQASFLNYENEIVGLVGAILNITEHKQNEKKLVNDREALQLSNTNKDRFFSIIAHDLKNPFITLLGFTEALLDDYYNMTSEEHLEYINQIQNTSKTSYQLLENLLQWSRSQSGRLQIEPVSFQLFEVVEEVISLKTGASKSKNISLTNTVGKDLKVFADKDMVKTIFRNLIVNAIKFTYDFGAITISASLDNKNDVVISVEDTGVGISEANIKNLFNIEKFYSSQGTKNEEGTGLGLVLCHEFVSKNKGEIWVESKLGKGSKFIFTLPVGQD